MAGAAFRLHCRPFVQASQAAILAKELFGLHIKDRSSVKELESYDDRNFLIECTGDSVKHSEKGQMEEAVPSDLKKYVLKVLHSKNTYSCGFLDAAVEAVDLLKIQQGAARKFCFPENVRGINGKVAQLEEFTVPLDYFAGKNDTLLNLIKVKKATGDDVWRVETDEDGGAWIAMKLYVRLLTFVPGTPLINFAVSDGLLFEVGVLTGIISRELKSFSHPSLVAKCDIWDLKNILQFKAAKYLDAVQNDKHRDLLKIGFGLFEKNFLPCTDRLPQQSIHSDINESNILVSETNGSLYVSGLIDFGDMTYSYHVFEVAIAMAYMAMQRPDDCIKAAGVVLSGFLSVSSLSKEEQSVLYYCLVSRITQSLIIGNYSHSLDPENEYILYSSKAGYRVLETFLNYRHDVEKVYDIWYNSRLERGIAEQANGLDFMKSPVTS